MAVSPALSPSQIADELGVHVRTVQKLIYSGDLPGFRVGRVMRVKRADLDAYVKAQRVVPWQ